jgi:DNA-directed RNA polymerase subunit RPC12/RpoP
MFNRSLIAKSSQGKRKRNYGGAGKEKGGGNKPGSGPGGNCVCPSCGHKISHQAGQRCKEIACPKCGTKMVRE